MLAFNLEFRIEVSLCLLPWTAKQSQAEIEKEVARRHGAEDGLAQLRQSHETLQQQAQAVQAELQAQRRENAAILEKQKRNDKEGEGRPGAANGTHDAALLKALEEEVGKGQFLPDQMSSLQTTFQLLFRSSIVFFQLYSTSSRFRRRQRLSYKFILSY